MSSCVPQRPHHSRGHPPCRHHLPQPVVLLIACPSALTCTSPLIVARPRPSSSSLSTPEGRPPCRRPPQPVLLVVAHPSLYSSSSSMPALSSSSSLPACPLCCHQPPQPILLADASPPWHLLLLVVARPGCRPPQPVLFLLLNTRPVFLLIIAGLSSSLSSPAPRVDPDVVPATSTTPPPASPQAWAWPHPRSGSIPRHQRGLAAITPPLE